LRTLIASLMALATAAIGRTIGTSPMPRAPNGWRGRQTDGAGAKRMARAPNGWRGFAFSTMTASVIGASGATGKP